MNRNANTWLLGSAIALMLAAIVAALISAQWKNEAIPIAALVVILGLTVVKARWVVMDFMGLRGQRPHLSMALIAWPSAFALAAAAKASIELYRF